MTKSQKASQESYGRIFQTIFEKIATSAAEGRLGHVMGGVHDASLLLEKTAGGKKPGRNAALFFEFGKSLGQVAMSANFDREYPQRLFLANLAINYLMLASETFTVESQEKEAEEALALSHRYSFRLSPEGDRFPGERLILCIFTPKDRPKHPCDMERARTLIAARHAHYTDCLSSVSIQISVADHILRNAEGLISSAEMKFELRCGEKIIKLRPDMKTPGGLAYARRHIARARKYIAAIDTAIGDTANVNRSRRTIVVAHLTEALVKCALVDVYDAYWKKSPKYGSFSVLAHQARSYAQACTGHNWEYFAAPAFFFPHEPLLEKTDDDVRLLCNYANAAYAYICSLNAELLVGWRRERMDLPEPVEVAVDEAQEKIETEVGDMGEVAEAANYGQRFTTQEAAASAYHSSTGEDLRENAHYGIGQYQVINPKQRMVGFHNLRSGKKHKRKNAR